jgi:predicted component of type VI protein secretion system
MVLERKATPIDLNDKDFGLRVASVQDIELLKSAEQTGALALHIAREFPGLELEFWALRGQHA